MNFDQKGNFACASLYISLYSLARDPAALSKIARLEGDLQALTLENADLYKSSSLNSRQLLKCIEEVKTKDELIQSLQQKFVRSPTTAKLISP